MATTTQARSGFALVIALTLMAFVLLLILSITSFVVVEQQSANIAKQQLAAKQNALVGLHIAIGELQQRLGPDQRATASADILNSSNNPYTLVWHSDPTKGWDSATKDWVPGGDADFALPLLSVDPAKLATLISSSGEFNESALDNPVELMAITKPSDGTLTSLKAERRPLVDAQGATTGNYAWVAQDESLKANLKTEHGDYQNTDSSLDLVETSRRLSVFPYANAAGVEIEGKLPFGAIDPVVNGELNDDYFEKIQKAEDLGDLITSGLLVLESKPEPEAEEVSKAEKLAPYRNHFTLNSKGVLADAKNGGLRRDLSRGLDDQYFEKLHGLPVFGIDADGNLADGINNPVGDQWKFFRDYYNFYRPVDDGLASDLGDENVFYGLNDVTSPNPSTRMRFANHVVSRKVNNRETHQGRGLEPTYSALVTPKTLTGLGYSEGGSNNNRKITNDNWNLFTPHLRPVILRNTLKIGILPQIFNDPNDEDNSNNGKYRLQFKVYPSITIWNPFNVAIDFTHNSVSQNPFANGVEVYLHHNSNMNLEIKAIPESGSSTVYKFNLGSIAPNVAVISAQSLEDAGLPAKMLPGAIWVCGLGQNYFAKRDEWNPEFYTNPTFTGSIGKHIPLVIGENILTDASITYNDEGYTQNGEEKWSTTFFKGTDTLHLIPPGTSNNITYHGMGQIKSIKPGTSTSTETFDSFYQGDNSNVYNNNTDPIELSTVTALAAGNQFPFTAVDIKARTLEDVSGNPSFASFAQMNLMGTYPQFVRQGGQSDVKGDVKLLYMTGLIDQDDVNLLDPIEDINDDGTGNYGASFSYQKGENNIVIYDLPRHPLVSVGDFRNLVLSWNEDTHTRPIGASWPLATLSDLSDPYIRTGASNWNYSKGAGCDTSYYYNNALFDSYFFSGIPSENRGGNSTLINQTFPYGVKLTDAYIQSGRPLANTRLSYYEHPSVEQLRVGSTAIRGNKQEAFETTAAHLLIDAPFNINSTSHQAWQAILSGFRGQEVKGADQSDSGVEGTPFVDHFVPRGDENDLYAGHRRLTDTQVRELSYSLTQEIRNRGIAISLGDFLNRDLKAGIDSDVNNDENNLMSRIDEAIKTAAINSITQRVDQTVDSDLYAVNTLNYTASAAHAFEDSLVDEAGAGLPGYLKQQDILRALAPIMTTRGDTFIIRAYGESVDPLAGNSKGEAWCEAVVQRLPEYVDSSTDDAWKSPPASSSNEQYGRRLKIIHFRWLNNNDISS